jgi:hypothetical protein
MRKPRSPRSTHVRSFILGLLVGGLAVHLWHRANRSRSSRIGSTRASVGPPQASFESRAESYSPAIVASAAPASGAASYQPACLDEYSPELQGLAEHLFEQTASLAGLAMSQKGKDGYSFLWERGGTAARVVIYQRRHGNETGAFPMLQDGVYVLLRTRASAPNTLGIAPSHEERFNYRRVSDINLEDVAHEIADVLHAADVVLK